MANKGKDDGGWLKAYKDGTTSLDPATNGDGSVTLVDSTTYYLPVGSDFAPLPAELGLVSVHLKWASAVAAVATVEASDFPEKVLGRRRGGGYDVTDYDATAGNWIQLNPTDAYVPVSGSGNSADQATVTLGGSAAGGCIFNLFDTGARRLRIKIVVTTGGKLWANAHGKD